MSAANLIASAPEIAPSNAAFERLNALRNYRGPPRTEISDADWDALRAALKALVPHFRDNNDLEASYEDLTDCIGLPLLSLQHSRPARELFLDFCEAADIDAADHWWDLHRDSKPERDWGLIFTAAFNLGWRAMSESPARPSTHAVLSEFVTQPEPEWLVDDVLMRGSSLAAVYGEPGSGKSTVVLELLLAIARGIPWHGRAVERGAVAYIAAESVIGLRKRLQAYENVNGVQLSTLDEWFFPIPSGLNLLNDGDVEKLIAYLKELPASLRAVAIDTLAQATPGANENTSDSMGLALNACKRIHRETGAIVLLIAHSGKDQARGLRGWSGILGALDTEIEVLWNKEANVRQVSVKKQRDAESNYTLFDCELQRVVYGTDGKGREVSSVVVREVEAKAESGMTVTELPNTPVRRAIRRVLGDAVQPMTFEEMIAAAKGTLSPPDPGKEDRRRDRLKATFERMIADKELKVDGQLISLASGTLAFALVPEKPTPTAANDDLVGGCQS